MRRHMTSFIPFCIIPLVAFAVIACSSPVSSSGGGTSSTKGSLTIALTNHINAKTLAPSIDMTAASFTVTGTGPSSATFTATSTGAAVTENSLAFGSWTIVVNAANAEGQLIGTGTTTAQVNTGDTTSVAVTVTPITGTGTLSLGVSWPASQVQTPSINASLIPALGSAQSLPFTISGATASYSNTAVGNGYYTLDFTLLDNSITVAGAVDVVRIVTGQTTSGTYSFSTVNAPGGTIQVNINANMQNPLTVAIAGASATLSQGSTQTLTASVSNYTANVVYVWYVNGVSAGTGSSFAFGSGATVGYNYRIDVTAFTADGTQAGSASQTVQVVPGGTSSTVYVGGYCNNGPTATISGYWKGDTWVSLANPYNGSSLTGSNSLAISGSDVYFGGTCNGSYGGYWKNGNWVGLTTPYSISMSCVNSLVVSGSDVYAGGSCVDNSGDWVACYWKNGTWIGLSNPYNTNNAFIISMAVSGSDFYAAGWCANNSGKIAAVYWKNSTSIELTNPYGNYNVEVDTLFVSGSDVYVGGACTPNGYSAMLAGYWKNGTWIGLTNSYGSFYSYVYSLTVSGSDVYAGGVCGDGTIELGGYWKDGTWVGLTNPNGPYNTFVSSMVVSGSDIYAGGSCSNSTSENAGGYWKNGSWVGLTNPFGISNSAHVTSLVLVN